MMEQEKDDITISAAQAIVDRWITTIGVRYFSPLTNMAVLTEEVGEVARIMAREYGDQSFKPGENAGGSFPQQSAEKDRPRHTKAQT